MRDLILVLLCIIWVTPAEAMTAEKERDINSLMDVMDINASGNQAAAEAMTMFIIQQEKKNYPNLSKDAEHEISEAVYKETLKEYSAAFSDMASRLYDKYYTHEEIKELLIFFSSKTGRKYTAVSMPMFQDIAKEIDTIIKEKNLGARQVKIVQDILKKHGYKI